MSKHRHVDSSPRPAPPTVPHGDSKRIPSLDGMRGVGVVLVFAAHVGLHGRPSTSRLVVALHHIGFAGVTMFLVVSGFLITLILVREYSTTGSISLRKFYKRRIVRLWPALWVVVGVTALLGALGYLTVNARNIISPLVFMTNYVDQGGNSALMHTWSLALEEQFYLVWPLAILWIGRKRLPLTLSILVVVAPLVRVASYFAFPMLRHNAMYQFHTRYDAMAVGCLLALMWGHPAVQRWLARPGPIGWIAVVGLVTPLVGEQVLGEKFMLLVGYSMQSVSLVVLVALGVYHHESIYGRVLNYKVFVAIGTMSYSLYLWQQMFLLNPWGWLTFWPLGVVVAVAVGVTSYYLLEKPFMKLGRTAQTPVRPLPQQESTGGTPASRSAMKRMDGVGSTE